MKLLIIGSGGMLGHMLTLYLKEQGYECCDVSKLHKCTEDTDCIDVLNFNVFSEYLFKGNFDVVINCAAMLVKASEENKVEAIKLNSLFPHWLERYYEKSNTRVIQVGTAGVYYGDNAPYFENSRHDTTNFYGQTKSLGELNNSKDLTVRSDYWGPDRRPEGVGLFNWALIQKKQVSGYNKVYINGISSLEFAKFIEYIINNPISGVINIHAKENITKADLLRKIYVSMKKDINVIDSPLTERNTCVKSERNDCMYKCKSYDQQLHELYEWIIKHKELYSHYFK